MYDFEYKHVSGDVMLKEHFDNGSIYALYSCCFGTAPYDEDFSINDVCEAFTEYCRDGILYLCLSGDEVIGFCATIPLTLRYDVYELIKDCLHDADAYWYHADIGIHPKFRGMGLAKILLQTVLDKTFSLSKKIIMRTNEKNDASLLLHKSFGFKNLMRSDSSPLKQTAYVLRKSGKIMPDTRVFMVLNKDE